MKVLDNDTIVAIATPPGYGGIGVVRLSGPRAHAIASSITQKDLHLNKPSLCDFYHDDQVIDQGLVLVFVSPHSFTGEDVVELQGHGSPWAQAQLLQACQRLGARMAEPGEFSKRAFLNGKMHLNEAEAVADLIHAASAQAAQSALQSLRGVFAEQIQRLMVQLREVRIFLEASLDFSDEEITLLERQEYQNRLLRVEQDLKELRQNAKQGCLLQQGVSLAIAGPVNAGKSSLLNRLSDESVAIVSEMAGTTRDIIKNSIQLDGLPVHLLDTAGWRESSDPIEQEGQRRAQLAAASADVLLWVTADHDLAAAHQQRQRMAPAVDCIVVMNKIDLCDQKPRVDKSEYGDCVFISAKTGAGLDLLRQCIKSHAGFMDHREGTFIARRRHCEALDTALGWIEGAKQDMQTGAMPECAAQACALAHQALATITGRADVEDLLDGIFSEFCIGK